MAVLGGFANFFGPIVGALAFTLLQDQLQSLTQYWRFILGAILALIVIGFPAGIAGLAEELLAALRAERRMTPLLETRHVSKAYGAFRALDDVSIAVQRGRAASRSSARTAPARPRWSTCSPA